MKKKIIMAASAFIKIQTLVFGLNREVGWFGTASKVDDNTYKIWDILVYPQYTNSINIDDVPEEMCKWYQTLTDNQFDMKRFHGHSHVSMSVNPSSTDLIQFEEFKQYNRLVEENRFTIELIINKSLEMYWVISDLDENETYKNKDIKFYIELEDSVTHVDFYQQNIGKIQKMEQRKGKE